MSGADRQQQPSVADGLRGHDVSPLLKDPEHASPDAIRVIGALDSFSMWAFMDAAWLQKIAAQAQSGREMTLDTLPGPDTGKRSSVRQAMPEAVLQATGSGRKVDGCLDAVTVQRQGPFSPGRKAV